MSLSSCFLVIIAKLLSGVKQLLCFLHIKRRRKNSGSLLPFHADTNAVSLGEVQTSLPTNDIQLTSWDSWEENGAVASSGCDSLSSQQQQMRPQQGGQFKGGGGPGVRYGMGVGGRKQQELPTEPETDYFQKLNLEPSIRRTPKILVRSKDESGGGNTSNRLSMVSDIPIVSGELGLMEDFGSGWADEACEDLSSEAISALRETRRTERVNKIAEHQQKKNLKESKKDKFSAVKLK